jgi:hypothetical protein
MGSALSAGVRGISQSIARLSVICQSDFLPVSAVFRHRDIPHATVTLKVDRRRAMARHKRTEEDFERELAEAW